MTVAHPDHSDFCIHGTRWDNCARCTDMRTSRFISEVERNARWLRYHAEALQCLQGREVGGMVADDILAVRFLLASIKIKTEDKAA